MKTIVLITCLVTAPCIMNKAIGQVTQTIRGIVTDHVLQTPVSHASVTLVDMNRGTTTAADGTFRLDAIPLGVRKLQVSCIGYKVVVVDNIMVNAGKEVVINISLDPAAFMEKEVVVKAQGKRNKPLNDFSLTSARAFTVDETQKFAASVNDPLRMATNFPGVAAINNGNDNDISIRGNSPAGLLWRMEGVDIPNPNHFATLGSSGGGISILSAQLLSNSDFLTGAFAADYGNALSGVFDLKLRKGNNERPEYTLQAGVLGLNAAAEGPLSLFNKGSYLVNYRYSTLELLNKIGFPLGDGKTNFQDLSFNVNMPTRKWGTFNLFGFGGISSEDNTSRSDSMRENNVGYTGMVGLAHTISLSNKSTLKSVVALSGEKRTSDGESIDPGNLKSSTREDYLTSKATVSTTLNHKFSNIASFRAGSYINFIHFNYSLKNSKPNAQQDNINAGGNTQLLQAFAEMQVKPFPHITMEGGLHSSILFLNSSKSLEPRGSIKWDLNAKSSLAFAYGNHSQMQSMGVYFGQSQNTTGETILPNKNLEFTKARHYVIAYNHLFSTDLKLKTELYFQQLYNVPVSTNDSSTYSTLNQMGEGYITQPGKNNGKGKNYGVELSLEKYLSHNYYFLLSSSLYKSKYTASDGVERNTRFAGNYVNNLVAGKDFVLGNNNSRFGVNIKLVYAGGFRYTPIDTAASRLARHAVYDEKQAYSQQYPAFFRTDLRLSYQWNKLHHTNTLSLDIQNLTNRKNIYDQYYDPMHNKIYNQVSDGLIPVLNYKIEF